MELLFNTVSNALEIFFFFSYFLFLGIFCRKILFKNTIRIKDAIELNALGFFIHFLYLTIANIFFPINSWLLLIPVLCFLFLYEDLMVLFRQIITRVTLKTIIEMFIFVLPAILWISNLSLGLLKYESGYYIQKIRWAQQFPLIPGLANLDPYYGLDSSHFLQLAFFDNIIFLDDTFGTFSGYLLFLGYLYFFAIPVFRLLKYRRAISRSDIMRLFFTPILIHYCFYSHPGPGTDLPVFIFGSILAVEIFRKIFEYEENLNFILICICLGFISKLSFLPTGFLSFIVLVYHFGPRIFLKNKINKVVFLFMIIGLFLQLHRNAVLTGYPLYPNNIISIPLKWKVKNMEVETLSRDISDWAVGIRDSYTDPKKIREIKKEWLKTRLFLQHRRVETLFPIILGLIGTIYVCFMKLVSIRKVGLFLLPAIGQICMWFFYARDARFATWAFWWIGAGLICYLIKDVFSKKLLMTLPILLLLFSFSLHLIDSLGQKKNISVSFPSYDKPKTPKSFIYTTASGLNIFVPYANKKCDDCNLPCTDYPKFNLRLIEEGEIASGFILD